MVVSLIILDPKILKIVTKNTMRIVNQQVTDLSEFHSPKEQLKIRFEFKSFSITEN